MTGLALEPALCDVGTGALSLLRTAGRWTPSKPQP